MQRFALTLLYLFHMPAFVFLTGVVAKPVRSGRKVLGLLSILVCFQVVFMGFLAVTGRPLQEWYWPYWTLWFIMAMIWWQLLTPVIKRWPKLSFVAACVAALAIGFAGPEGNWFAYQRAIAFLPFFVAGCAWGTTLLNRMSDAKVWRGMLLATGFMGATALVFFWNLERHWFFQNWTYGQFDESPVGGGIFLRAFILMIGGLGTLALLALLPSSTGLARIGRRTLPVFIFHAFPVLAFGWWVMPYLETLPGSVLLIIGIALGVFTSFILANKRLAALTDFVRQIPEKLAPQNTIGRS